LFFFFSSRRRHTRFSRDWSSDVCSSDLGKHQRRREDRSERQRESWLQLRHQVSAAPTPSERSRERSLGSRDRKRFEGAPRSIFFRPRWPSCTTDKEASRALVISRPHLGRRAHTCNHFGTPKRTADRRAS